jgi:hypothetical protein
VKHAHSECANLYPGVLTNNGTKQTCTNKISPAWFDQDDVNDEDGYRLGWRYITKDGRYVMAKQPESHGYSHGQGVWKFVPRSTFGKLCQRPGGHEKPVCDNG